MRVIDDHPVATSAGHAFERHSLPEPSCRCFVLDLFVLVTGQGYAVAPSGLIPFGCDKTPHLHRITDGERHGMGGADISQIRHIARPPFPRGPQHVAEQGLHCARRDVDQQTVIIPLVVDHHFICDCLKMLGDGLDMPVVQVFLTGLNDVPSLFDELDERKFAHTFFDREARGV